MAHYRSYLVFISTCMKQKSRSCRYKFARLLIFNKISNIIFLLLTVNQRLSTTLSPICEACSIRKALAGSYSFGIRPSRIASLINVFSTPTSRHGDRLNIFIMSSPETGGWKLRIRSFSSMSTSFLRTSLKLSINRFFFCSFLEVISASHNVIRSSMSSPASNSRRLTAESVTSSSAIAIGLHLFIHRQLHFSEYLRNHLLANEIMVMESPSQSWIPSFTLRFTYIMKY